MVSCSAQIEFHGVNKSIPVSVLQAAEIAAHYAGFHDIDLKDNDLGNYRLIAYGKNMSVQGRGKTLEEAVESLLEKIL